MKALVKERPEPGLSLLDVDVPQIRNTDDVLFKVAFCAICEGEKKVYEWNAWAASDATLRLPTVLGHEVSGIVEQVGSGVRHCRPGDRIVVDPFIFCGACRQCRSGHTNMCANREIYGKRRGAFGAYAVVPERVVCRIPDTLSMEDGALLENFGIAVHAVEHAPHDAGDTAVVIGAGPIGIMAGQALAAAGVRVVMTDLVESRLQLAARLTGGETINVATEDPRGRIEALTDGAGADYVIEAAATQSALDQAFDVVRDRGTIVTIGTFNEPVTFNPFFRMTRRELRLISSIGRTGETWRRMIQLLGSGKIQLQPLITQCLPLEQFETGFGMIGSPDIMKVLLYPEA